MRKRLGKCLTGVLLMFAMCAAAGCEPTKDPRWQAPTTGKTVRGNAWQQIASGVEQADAAGNYAALYHVYTKTAGSSYEWTGDATVSHRGQFLLSVSSNRIGYVFYQQNQSAYVERGAKWVRAKPISSTDLFTPYRQLVQHAEAKRIHLSALPRAFVGNEYCIVLRAVIPAAWLTVPPGWQAGPAQAASSDVVMTFYVGQKSHRLRFIETVSSSSPGTASPVEIDTNIEFYFEAAKAKLVVPASLTHWLGHALT